MLWKTEKHGEIRCEFRGFDDDGNVIIRVPDPYDPGVVEIHVPRQEIVGLPEEQTKVAIAWSLMPARSHCQNGGDVCLAGNRDGVCCPEDSCDIDDGIRKV